jgi:hypothetical protein
MCLSNAGQFHFIENRLLDLFAGKTAEWKRDNGKRLQEQRRGETKKKIIIGECNL